VATVPPVRASVARPDAATPPTAARRPVARSGRSQPTWLRRALPLGAFFVVVVVAISLLSSLGGDKGGTRVAQVRAPNSASDIAQVVQTTAAKTQAQRAEAERLIRSRLAAARRRALPPAQSVSAPAPTPQPVYQAPASGGGSSSSGGAWGGEFGP
jgi:hypothetical protein